MKFLFDMNLSPRWVNFFTNSRIESIHWKSIGAVNASDSEIMDYARSHDYVIITHDLDFGAILTVSCMSKPSVIQLRTIDISPESSAGIVIPAIQKLRDDLEKGAIITIDNKKIRLHSLSY
jgi:predicted nuclease of predicted toxin-antitoxin system